MEWLAKILSQFPSQDVDTSNVIRPNKPIPLSCTMASGSRPKQRYIKRSARGPEIFVECRQRQIKPPSEFEIGSVVEREPAPFCQLQRGCPGMTVRVGIDVYLERLQVRNRRISERRGDPFALDRHL